MDDDQQLERFLRRLKEDRALGQAYLAELGGAIESAVAVAMQRVAERHGFRFSVDAARAHLKRRAVELDPKQLDEVVGGVTGPALSIPGAAAGTPARPTGGGPSVLAGIVAAAIAAPLADDHDSAR
jgi:hypothetical protein